jgi:Peptidase family M28/PDZ domain
MNVRPVDSVLSPRSAVTQPHVRFAACLAVACLWLAACIQPAIDPFRTCCPATPATRASAQAIRNDIAYLAADRLEGRGTGTPGNDSAAAYIARRFEALQLRQIGGGYRQPFIARPAAGAHSSRTPVALPTQNVVAIVPGSDPALSRQYVVIGAHFDHLGRSSEGALDPDQKNAIRNGADDNASGTAAILELARLLAASPTRRSVVIAAFSGEEAGLLGSQYFVEHSPVPLDSVVGMLNFDMVGRLRDERLIVYGVATATELPGLLDSANVATSGVGRLWDTPLRVTALGDGFGPSDHSSFYARNIPVLHFFTDLHEDYHRSTDDVRKINARGEAHVVDLAERVVRAIGDRDARLTFVRSAMPMTVASGSREGSNVYLGSIPDMSAGEGVGLKLTGVRAGSPAEKAGMVAGDVVIEFAGQPVKDLYGFSNALYSHKPGDDVTVVVLRNGARKSFVVKLGTRGN